MVNRRTFVTRLLGTTALIQASGFGILASNAIASLTPTPSQAEGPYYPVAFPDDKDWDLLKFASSNMKPKGIPLELTGRILSPSGAPRPNMRIDIWQADANGIYDHPRAPDTQKFDPEFQGAGQTMSDENGFYRFLTLVPTPYTGRPPHIHVKIWDGDQELLTTQLYLKDHPDNEKNDSAFGSLFFRNTEKLLMTLTPKSFADGWEGRQTQFDFVL